MRGQAITCENRFDGTRDRLAAAINAGTDLHDISRELRALSTARIGWRYLDLAPFCGIVVRTDRGFAALINAE